MEIKGIDVSAWQGKIDWKKVSDYGMGFVLIRITEAGNAIDSQFENNYAGCTKYNIPIGVYKYSYARTISEAQNEAKKIIQVLNGRKLQYPIWYDLEWNNQRALGSENVHKLAEAFEKVVTAAGYKFGIYCNVDWYSNFICSHLKKYDFWIARYPANDNGTLQERLRPGFGVGWQYSSKSTIPGIPNKVDRNVFYKDYSKISTGNSTNSSQTTNSNNSNKGSDNVTNKTTKEQAINAVIKVAQNEIGYLEKKSNAQLNSKTANAGYNNFTKYWRDVYPAYQGQAWCACFISWIFMKTFGLAMAKKLLKHWPYVYCPTLGSLFTKNANPKVGDIVIFYRNGTFAHTGLVTKVQGDRFWTIEGNTSGASGIVANGGGVCAKSYYNSKLPGTKFCTPNYSLVTSIVSGNSSTSIPTTPTNTKNYLTVGDKGDAVKTLQTKLNKVGYKLTVDGIYGDNTLKAVKSFQTKYKKELEVDGVAGKNTISKLDSVIAAQNKKISSTTSKAPSKVRKFVGKVNKNNAPVRKNPGKKYAQLTSYPTLNKGNLVDVCDTIKSASGNDWYYICIGGKIYGYIFSGHVERV